MTLLKAMAVSLLGLVVVSCAAVVVGAPFFLSVYFLGDNYVGVMVGAALSFFVAGTIISYALLRR